MEDASLQRAADDAGGDFTSNLLGEGDEGGEWIVRHSKISIANAVFRLRSCAAGYQPAWPNKRCGLALKARVRPYLKIAGV